MAIKIRKGDTVQVIAGDDKGKTGRVLAVDLAGFGRTPRAGRSAKLTANRALLSRFLEEVVGAPAILAGNSMGGGIAVMQAAVEPASVEGLILSSSVYPWAPGGMPSPVVVGGFALYRGRIGEWVARQRVHAGNASRIVRLGFRVGTVHPEAIPEDLIEAHVELLEEQATDLESQDSLQGIEKASLQEIAQIKHAIDRIKSGQYGQCSQCGEPIAPERLKAQPTATRCIDCAA